MHWNSLRSLLRTYEMSTCRKSIVSICHYSTRRKKRGMRVVGVQQTNSGGEGRRRKGKEGKVKLFPSPAPPSRPLQCVCSFYAMPLCSSYAPPAVWLFDSLYTWCSDAKDFFNARNCAEKKTLLAGYAEATYDCTFSILQSVNFKCTIHMLTVLKRLNFEIVVSYGKCVSRK